MTKLKVSALVETRMDVVYAPTPGQVAFRSIVFNYATDGFDRVVSRPDALKTAKTLRNEFKAAEEHINSKLRALSVDGIESYIYITACQLVNQAKKCMRVVSIPKKACPLWKFSMLLENYNRSMVLLAAADPDRIATCGTWRTDEEQKGDSQ